MRPGTGRDGVIRFKRVVFMYLAWDCLVQEQM